MAWTAPRTWVSSEIVTASLMNTHIRDNLLAIDAMFGIATAPATGRVPVGDGSNFTTHAHAFVSAASLLLRHEIGGLEFDVSAITTGGMLIGASAGAFEILGAGSNGAILKMTSGKPAWDTSIVTTKYVADSRLASEGGGTQNVTGAGFAPAGAFVIASGSADTEDASWGFVDASDAESTMMSYPTDVIETNTNFIYCFDGTNGMYCTAALSSDGVDLTWTKQASGMDVTFYLLFIGATP